MFHSAHPAAALHAAARAVSGGPVYVSDRPGRHDFGLLRRLVLPDGSVLRCAQPGRPTPDCLFADPQRDGASALKVRLRLAATAPLGAWLLLFSDADRGGLHWISKPSSPPSPAPFPLPPP